VAFDPSSIEPGVVITEQIVPNGVNVATQPIGVALIGVGNRDKRVSNEAVVRGQVADETLTFSGSSPYIATLANRASRVAGLASISRTLNGNTQALSSNAWAFNAATVAGTNAGPFVMVAGTNNAFALEIDGLRAVTMVITNGGANSVTLSNQQINVVRTDTLATLTRAQFAAAINAGLNAATTLGFSATHVYATDITTGVRITGRPISEVGSASDVRLFAPAAQTGMTLVFGSATLDAASVVRLVDETVYSASAVFEATYVALTDNVDGLTETPTRVVRVGSYPGLSDFAQGTDWTLNSGDIDWTPDTAATLTGANGTYDLDPDDTFSMSLDGLSLGTFDLVNGASTVLGFDTTVVSAAAATPTEVTTNINALAAWTWGPRYATIAALSGSGFTITSPNAGRTASNILITSNGSTSQATAVAALFGSSFTDPTLVQGAGRRPTLGSVYYVTYDYVRPTNEYNRPYLHTTLSSAQTQIGAPSFDVVDYNPLAIASELAFLNGAPYIFTIQINDATLEGTPTIVEIEDALNGATITDDITEVIIVGEPGTRAETYSLLVSHVEDQNGPVEKHYRRVWAGAARDTVIGDANTPGTLRFFAGATFQVGPSSPGRGRMFFAAPPQESGVSRTVRLDDGSSVSVDLDGTFLAAVAAAKRASFLSPASTLTRQNLTGFNLNDITDVWTPPERRQLINGGLLLVGYDGGVLRVVEGVSTERAGGALAQFEVDSSSPQKDTLVRKVIQAIDDNLVGLVPLDLANFLLDIKVLVGQVITGEIASGNVGPYTDATTGAVRDINLATDIIVRRRGTDARVYEFDFWFNLRMPALKFLGTFSVDTAFFSAS
jgi:hypothetical protein